MNDCARIAASAVLIGVAVLSAEVPSPQAIAAQRADDHALIARGRYLVQLGGCNDCHTEGFAESGAKVPERQWLQGSRTGWHGPWGTTYAVNLRLLVSRLTPQGWVQLIQTMHPKPPMPWWALRWMTPHDQRAVYAFIRHLGPAGTETPADLPMGSSPPQPTVLFPMPPAPPAKPR